MQQQSLAATVSAGFYLGSQARRLVPVLQRNAHHADDMPTSAALHRFAVVLNDFGSALANLEASVPASVSGTLALSK